MKKLLSICFLSILLGLLSFSAQAQNCGFVIKNLQPDTIEGVVQMSPDGLLPLEHTLGHGVFINPTDPYDYYGNATVDRTELYELFLCNSCDLDDKTKVSLDWILQRQDEDGNWVTVNDNLSDYVDFDIYTLYPEINNLGVCNSITWLGGRVPNGFGYCEQAVAPDMFHGITCNTPTNYPGAVPVGQGTPYSVMNQLGELIPAMGMTPIYTEALDYFYYDFFRQTRTLVQLKWKQVGNYRLIMNLRERVGGTAWNNLTWNENETTDFIGGHQSCCGQILASDTLTYPVFREWSKEVCDNEHFDFGMPVYDFHVTMPDTNVVFGRTLNASTNDCAIFNADSIYRFHFFVRHTPQVVVLKEKDTLCKCSVFGEEQLLSMIDYDTLDFQYASSHKFFWYYWGANGYGWYEQMPNIDTVVGTNTYTVRQVNTYNNYNQFYSEVLDTIVCTGDEVTLMVTFVEMDPPTVPQPGDVCLEVIDSNFVFPVTAQHDAECASTTRWYKTVTTSFHNNKTEYLEDLVYTGDEFPIHLIDYAPATNIDKTVKFYAVSYDETRDCESKYFTIYTIEIHQTPELKKVITPNDINCPGAEVTMSVEISNNPDKTDAPYTFKWNGDLTEVLNGERASFVLDANDTCGTSYLTTVYVIDGNGCQSEPVEFTYTTNDTVAPVITPNAATYTINACEINAQNTPKFTTLADLAAAFNLNITDNCNTDLLTLDAAVVETTTTSDCEKTLVRTYTVRDHCGNPATFTQTVTAHDSVAPIFRDPVTNQSPYIRMIPTRDSNCTYNAPDKATFVTTILPVVSDNCTEMTFDWLMEHAEFYWENSELFDSVKAPGTKNIFGPQVGNQLTVRVIVEDKCGNEAQAMILYFNRPGILAVGQPSITVNPANICLGETAALTFDPTKVTFDPDFELATPLTYVWNNLENEVELSDTNAAVTTVTPTVGDKTYHFQMTVTDAWGCTATSEYDSLFVKANPNVKIVKDIRNGATEPYCPTYGVMTIEAVDAVTGTKIPNLSYTWSGESVNVNESIEDTSFISIIPTLCTHTYTANVHVVDTIYGCVGDASISVLVSDNEGPVYTGDVINITVERQNGCKMYVPDFIHYLNNSNIVDNCYPFSAFKDSFRQDPVEGTEITEDTPVTIYVTTPCDNNEYAITGKFFARIPDNMLHVSAAVEPADGCDSTTFTFTATPQLGVGAISYAWTKQNSTWTANTQTATNTDTVVAGAAVSTYTYTVKATDAVGCEATASVNVTVYKTITEIDTITYPNTNCSAPWNGQLVVFHAPVGTHYELTSTGFYMERVSEVPGWDSLVTENTLIFDFLPQGQYLLTVTTPKGCKSYFDVNIREVLPIITFNDEVVPHDPTFCTNDNGYITIDAEDGYTYEVYDAANVLVASPYDSLTVGDYRIVKTSTVNRCVAETTVTINPSTTTMTFTVSSSANTLCGDVDFNGKVAFTTAGWTYTVTNVSTGEVIYEGIATTLNTLAEGTYNVAGVHNETGCTYTHPNVTVADGRNNPNFTVTPASNHYCENAENLADGKLTISNKQNNTTYTYAYLGTIDEPVAEPVYVNYPSSDAATGLAAGNYTVKAVNAENCVTEVTTVITDDRHNPTFEVSSTDNSSCNPEVMAYNGTATVTITNTNTEFNTYIKNYTVVFNGETVSDIAAKAKTFNGLNEGIYNFTVISNYLCEAQGEVEVEQAKYPALAMHATPNTMCVGTFEHPGNGTIVMDDPYRQNKYDFSYYYSTDAYAAGTQLQVNYFDPLSFTMYHLIDTLYYVLVYDTQTGCYVHDTITVPLGRDNVVATAEATANKNCQAPYDGTVTVTAEAYKLNTTGLNVDAVLAYQLVGETNNYTTAYQLSPTFSGVPDGTYTVNVKDTTTGCVYTFGAATTVDKTPVDYVITPTVTYNHACENQENPALTPWDGTISITATSTIFPNAQFVYSFNGGAFSTTNSWTGLAPASYPIVVRDLVSGCDSTVNVEVTTDNVCAPDVTITAIGENNIPYHFCLNTNPARLCATASTSNTDCPATEYSYKWHVDCHSLDFDGSCVDVATDEVHNCTYTVTVTSLATGCKTVESSTVVIDPIHTIHYLVNDVPFDANPRTVYNCVNKDIKIGIEQNSWVEAWWTNAHVTVLPDDNPEYNFMVYANTTTPNNMYSYCVNVVDDHGCPATGVINLISKPLPTATVYDTACNFISVDNHRFAYVDGTPDADYNVHLEYEEVTADGGVNGCDSITIHKITLLGTPTITGTVADHFCAGTTIATAIENLNITNAVDTIIKINGTPVTLNSTLSISPCTPVTMSIEVSAGQYYYAGVETFCSITREFSFVVNAAPQFTGNLVVQDYCATGAPVDVAVPALTYNVCNTSEVSLHLYIYNDDNTVYTDLGAVTTNPFSFIPRRAYNGKKLALVATNVECGSATTTAVLRVDSTVVTISDITLCEGVAIDVDAVIADDYENITGHIVYTNPVSADVVYNGQAMTMDENGAGFYAVITGEVCPNITTNTVTITVNPLPTVALNPAHDLCLENAAAALTSSVTVQHATAANQKWQYKASASATTYTEAADVNALVNAIKDMPEAQIAYHVSNDCGQATAYTTVRILAPVTMTVSPDTVLVCPGTSVQDALAGVTITPDQGNYTDAEVELVYKVGNVEFTDPADVNIHNNSTVTLIYRPKADVLGCGQATATVTVNVKTFTHTNPSYRAACEGNELSAFVTTNPTWTGTASLVSAQCTWQVRHGLTGDFENATTSTAIQAGDYVCYRWVTECGNTVTTPAYALTVNDVPEVTVNSSITICEGNAITLAQTGLSVTYHGNSDKYSTVWTIDGNAFDFSTELTAAEYDGKTLTVTLEDNGQACGSVSKNITLHVNALPVPTITGPAKACDGEIVTFTAEAGYTSYNFNITGNYSNMTVSGNTATVFALADGVEFLTANVTVTDANGCTGSSSTGASIRVTDRPEFIFYNADGSVNNEHVYTSETGTGLEYGWMINTNCDMDDKLVYVEFDYYYNGEKITNNDAIGEYLMTQIQTDEYSNTYPYVTALTFSWLNGDHSQHNPVTSLYNFAVANPNVSTAGNHFPNTNLGLTNTNVYDDLWMHFIGDRKVDASIVPFRLNGEFKVVYKLYSTTHENDLEHLYYENSHHMDDNYYGQTLHLGGQNAFTNNPTITLLVTDSIIINVTGENIVPSTTPGDDAAMTPEVAPSLSLEETAVAPDMEVWPNPAPAAETTLKARVHNLSGNATVTLTNLTGKQVYKGDIYIDNDNYYFEFNVNSLSVGSYIMTVRTATDVITKKVIVTTLAR